jgi:hypothetical protein
MNAAAASVTDDRRAVPRSARAWFTVTSVVAWAGVLLQAVLTIGNIYPAADVEPGEIDYTQADGLLGVLGRAIDFISYFTILSNLLVAIVVTALALDPARDSRLWRVLRLTSLIMIVVTGIVYAVLLAPDAVNTGWQVPANQLVHIWTPLLTVLGWLVVGPRGWIDWRTVLLALVIPLVWIGYTLVRGVAIEAYPYNFINVLNLGYGTALQNVAGVLVFGLVVAAVFWGLDLLLLRLRRGRAG